MRYVENVNKKFIDMHKEIENEIMLTGKNQELKRKKSKIWKKKIEEIISTHDAKNIEVPLSVLIYERGT